MDKDQLANLHRQASSSFLKGDLDSAITYWREVLELDPDDQQARDGLRVCEIQSGAGEPTSTAPEPAAPPPPTPPTPAATAEGSAMGEVLDDCLGGLDDKLDLGPSETQKVFPETPEQAQPAEAAATTVGADGGTVWEWGVSGEDEPPAPAEAPVAEVPVAEVPVAGVPVAGAPVADVGAATELRRRIDALLAQARASLSEGETDQARSTLDRVLILDESNEAALAMKQQLTGQPAEAPDVSGAMPDLVLSGAEAAAAPVGRVPVAEAPTAEAPDETAPNVPQGVPRHEDPLGDDQVIESEDDRSDEVSVSPELARGGAGDLRSPRMFIAAGLVLLLAVGWFVWSWLGGGSDEAELAGVTVDQPQKKKKKPKPEPQPSETPPEGAAPAALTVENLATLFDQAETAFAAEDYASAVVLYDKILDAEPENVAASERLEIASERYRDQRDREQRWEDVAQAFGNRNYTEALRILYRMPEGEDPKRIESDIVSAWYNLGVIALQSGHCDNAVENLDEALEASPGDAGAAAALGLARDCGRRDPRDFRATVQALSLRALSGP